jgi:hypothetical protein
MRRDFKSYEGANPTNFGGGKNSEILFGKLEKLDHPRTTHALLKRFAKFCGTLTHVRRIPDAAVRAHLVQLLLADVSTYLDRYHSNLPPDLRQRFLACARRQAKK